ncbi:hypothetical protein [Shewanella sp. 30m-9]
MKKLLIFTIFLSSSLSYSAHSQVKIDSKEAPFYEGENVVACGVLKQVTKFKRGLYFNLDERYPRQSLTLVVWEDDLYDFKKRFGTPDNLVGNRVCGKGKVTEYKGRNQINLYNSFSFNLDSL